jgi:hypothetical protein
MSIEVEITVSHVSVISIPATAATEVLCAGRCRLAGWSLRESTGAATATVEFTSGGNPVGELQLGDGESDTQYMGDTSIHMPSDLTLNVIAGSVVGAVYLFVGW